MTKIFQYPGRNTPPVQPVAEPWLKRNTYYLATSKDNGSADKSGATYWAAEDKYLVVRNNVENILKFNRDGSNYGTNVNIDTADFIDTESMTYLGESHPSGKKFAVVNEGDTNPATVKILLLNFALDDTAPSDVVGYDCPNINTVDGNYGAEGVAWDERRGVFYIVTQACTTGAGGLWQVHIDWGTSVVTEKLLFRWFDTIVAQGHSASGDFISELYYNPENLGVSNFFVLHNASPLGSGATKILEISLTGTVLATRALPAGQYEGLAFSTDAAKDMFICTEQTGTDIYVFKRNLNTWQQPISQPVLTGYEDDRRAFFESYEPPFVPTSGQTATPDAAVSTWMALDPTIAVGGVTVTPTEAISTWVANDPSIVAGGVTAAPAEAISTWVANNPTVVPGNATAAPAEAISTWVANDPAVVPGGVTAAPAEAISTWVANDPTIVTAVTAAPAEAISTWVANDPTAVPGGVTASPAEAISTWVANDPTAFTDSGPQTASPAEAISTWTANDPATAQGGVTASPAAAISTWVANDPATAQGNSTASPAEAISTWVANDPTIAVGGVTASPAEAISTWVANDPTAFTDSGPQTASPAEAISTWVANDPTIAVGGVTASPAAAISTWTANDPTAVAAVTVSPSEANSTWTANDPTTAQGGVIVSPTEAISTWVANDPIAYGAGTPQSASPSAAISTWLAYTPEVLHGPKISGVMIDSEPTGKYRRAQAVYSRSAERVRNNRSEDGMR